MVVRSSIVLQMPVLVDNVFGQNYELVRNGRVGPAFGRTERNGFCAQKAIANQGWNSTTNCGIRLGRKRPQSGDVAFMHLFLRLEVFEDFGPIKVKPRGIGLTRCPNLIDNFIALLHNSPRTSIANLCQMPKSQYRPAAPDVDGSTKILVLPMLWF